MKKYLLAILLAGFTFYAANAQGFEGKVVFSISFEDSGLPPEALTMLKGAESVMYIKGDKRRVDMNTAMQSTTSIVDDKAHTVLTTMDIMGQKYLIKMNEADLKKEKEDAPEVSIKYTEDAKTIAGYKCLRADVTMKDKSGMENLFIVYYTTDIPTNTTKSTFEGLKGFPLEYAIAQGGIRMNFTAKSVEKTVVPDSKFELAKEGYTETTLDELTKTMMGGR